MLIGYARVSTQDQKPAMQLDQRGQRGDHLRIAYRPVQRHPVLATSIGRVRLQGYGETGKGRGGNEKAGEGRAHGMLAGYARVSTQDQQPALSEQDLQQARALLKDPDITVEQVVRRLGVGVSTLYRNLPGGRGGVELDRS